MKKGLRNILSLFVIFLQKGCKIFVPFHHKNLAISIISSLALGFVINIMVLDQSEAKIIRKESYSIKRYIKYKNSLNIKLLPFKGKLSKERIYLKGLLSSALLESVLAYKSIRIEESIIEFDRKEFQVTEQGRGGSSSRNNFLKVIISKERINVNDLPKGTDQEGVIINSGIDIVVKGHIDQGETGLRVNITVYNNIYGKIFEIEREGSYKNINNLLDDLSFDFIKAVIVKYGCLNISSKTNDAILNIDGRYFGKTKGRVIVLETGLHKVFLTMDGMKQRSFNFIITENEIKSIDVSLNIAKDYSSNKILIATIPAKSRVYLDSSFVGYSPVEIDNFQEGLYRLRVDRDGYISKYKTLRIGTGVDEKITIGLEKGDSRKYYFTRTSLYNDFFQYSFWGATVSFFSFFYYGLKREDEQNSLAENRSDKRIDRYTRYQNFSLISAFSLFITSGVFYYFDIKQDDIAIALYPQPNRYNANNNLFCSDKCGFGLIFTCRIKL